MESSHLCLLHMKDPSLTKKLVEVCGILDKLECGDEIMADKGFQIQDLLAPLGVRLNVQPFLNSKKQMPVANIAN